MDDKEIRLRCIEAAAKNLIPHTGGYAIGVMETAKTYHAWITEERCQTGEQQKK